MGGRNDWGETGEVVDSAGAGAHIVISVVWILAAVSLPAPQADWSFGNVWPIAGLGIAFVLWCVLIFKRSRRRKCSR